MAAAKTATKTTAHKSTVLNPSNRLLNGATSKQTATKKKGSTVTKKTATKKNPAQPVTRRNPALSNEFVVAFGGALAVVGFDIAVNRFFPTVSGLIRTGAKFGVGWAIGKYGKRLPLIGGFSGLIKTGLYIAGALDLVTTYAVPYINQWLGAPSAVTQPVLVAENVPTAAGEMGNLYQYPNGQQFIVVDDRAPNYIGGNPYIGANPYATNYAGVY